MLKGKSLKHDAASYNARALVSGFRRERFISCYFALQNNDFERYKQRLGAFVSHSVR